MNEGEVAVDSGGVLPRAASTAQAASAGSLLREARMAAGVHIESIAFSLKVPVGKIDALERDDASAFPDATFMRALAGSVCRGLRIDTAPVLALMPQSPRCSLAEQSSRTHATFRDPSASSRSSAWVGRSSRWLASAVLLLLIGAAAVVFVPQDWKMPRWTVGASGSMADAGSPVVTDLLVSTASTPPMTDASLIPLGTQATGSAVAARSDSQSALGSAEFPVTVADMAVPTAPVSEVDASPSGLLSSTPAATRLFVAARGETWVQVMDANRKVLLERILKKGESASVNQAGRLFVVIGRADVADVQVAGGVRDITKNARDNVARFEVEE